MSYKGINNKDLRDIVKSKISTKHLINNDYEYFFDSRKSITKQEGIKRKNRKS